MRRPVRFAVRAAVTGTAVFVGLLAHGCSTGAGTVGAGTQSGHEDAAGLLVTGAGVEPKPAVVPAATAVSPVAHREPPVPTPPTPGDNGTGGQDAAAQPATKITLPTAVALCVRANFRVLAEAERVEMADADLTTSSLIPNPSLFADYQLIPLQHVNPQNQLGPPQWDALVTYPIDWLLFGKRVAAMRAARLGIEVSGAAFQNVLRTQVARTVDAFYEVLMDEAYLKLAEKNLAELTDLERVTRELVTGERATGTDLDRIKLAVHEAVLERHDRELSLEVARAKFRPLIGRTAADPGFEIDGDLTVAAVVPPPKLADAIALAEAHRPDLLAGRKAVEQANAVVAFETRRARPQVSLQPGWTYQNQRYVDGFRNGSLLDVGVVTTLPLTDRNQGNIRKAAAAVRERRHSYQGDRADVLAEVEAGVTSYADAVEHLTQFNTPETLRAAYDLRTSVVAGYKAGTRKVPELLDAQRAYQSRLGHVVEFEAFYWRQLNNLNAVVGLTAYDPARAATPLPPDGAGRSK